MKYRAGIHSVDTETPHPRGRLRKTLGKTARPKHNNADIRLQISDLLDALPFYVMLVDDQHHILLANRTVQAQLGLKPEDIVGKYCPTVVHQLDEPWYACPLEEAAEKGEAVEREALDQKSGRWIRSAIYPMGKSTQDGRRIFFHMVSDITDQKQAEGQLRASQEQLRDLSQHLESIREEERTKLAREIHDELGQILTGLKIDMSWMAKRVPKTEGPLVEKTKAMDELIDKAIETMKRISTELRPGVLDYLGLGAAIEWLTQELGKRTKIKFEFKSNPKEVTLDRDYATALFRICQEALTNVVRHANATRVKITLKKEPDRIVLVVRDNGKGINEEQISDPKAFGLIGMRERAHSYGGEVEISSAPRQGTVVAVNIPLTNERN
jgi:PAS domain S-box-containing protein